MHASPFMMVAFPAVLALSAAFAGFASAKPVKAVRPRDSTTCYSGVYIISARGTFEPQNHSLSDVVAQAIVDAIPDSAYSQIIYPANATLGVSEPEGILAGQQAINDYYTACPNSQMVIMGYSQGAQVMGDVLAGSDGSDGPVTTALSQDVGSKSESTAPPASSGTD